MSIRMIQERLDAYQCRSEQEEENALREITQEVALAALSRTDFFKAAAFQGGTCLRIFYSLNRFSEDLDFILQHPNRKFSLEPYLKNLALEFKAYGYQLEVQDRTKADQTVQKAFLKDDSIGRVLSFHHLQGRTNLRKIKVKFEIDTNPPSGSHFESKFHDFPFPFSATLQDPPSLFSGKLHALLCRNYSKGRDWYDFLWYTSRKIKINFPFLKSALAQIGPWQEKTVDVNLEWIAKQLEIKIKEASWPKLHEELARFLKPEEQKTLQIWTPDFFLTQVKKLTDV